MTETLQLQKVIDLLHVNDRFHICIHDISGFTQPELLTLRVETYIHSSLFCETAKKTAKGMKRCFACKTRAVNKAINTGQPYQGNCPMGLSETVVPIMDNEKTVGIIFIGNIMADREKAEKKIRHAAALTGVSEQELREMLPTLCSREDADYFMQLGLFLRDYIKLLIRQADYSKQEEHWAVQAAKRYIDSYFNKKITIGDIAAFYHINPTYLGRLFKKETGISIAEHLNILRVKKARKLLRTTGMPVIDVSMNVGFENVTYFNRIFKELEGMTPVLYRKSDKIK
ncbi:MAG: hypothetical protein BGN88_12990 [Clostridiales bacterium 43-6]|nr:MAG: hypothetical protein BGN88_12990 [Clostridiales bacterium 43-6]